MLGLFRLDRRTESWEHYHHIPEDSTSLSFDIIFSLLPDPDGTGAIPVRSARTVEDWTASINKPVVHPLHGARGPAKRCGLWHPQ